MPQDYPAPSPAGSFRLFRLAGISVYLHWSWFLVAAYEIQSRSSAYTIRAWIVAEYLALFAIVLLHEFGHALACRHVGGRADRIVLWPLGGVAFVSPPPRPGALLWSIVAGPLVNLLLLPILFGGLVVVGVAGLRQSSPDAAHFVQAMAFINLGLLVFNMLPVYPLDGGQTLQALLWFVIGRARSLLVVSVIGFAAGAGAILLAVFTADVWIGVLAAFVVFQSVAGFRRARLLAQLSKIPRHADAVCPSCRAHPFAGDFWACGHCHTPFDPFIHQAVCPTCGNEQPVTVCPECQQASPIGKWFATENRQADSELREE
jgi:Zn-dependent protease